MTTPQVPEGEMAVRLSVNCPVRTGTRASYVGGTENAISKITMICFDKDGKVKQCYQRFQIFSKTGKNPNYYIDEILESHGLSEDMLTDAECNKIMRAING